MSGNHGIEFKPDDPDAARGQDVHVKLGIMAEFWQLLILEQRPEPVDDLFQRQLGHRVQYGMSERQVPRLPWRDRQGNADDTVTQRVQAGGLGIERKAP